MLSPLYVNMMVSIPHPGSLSEGAAERSEAEGVYFDEWYNVKISEFRRGDENRPPTPDFSEYLDEWEKPIPGSLSEGAGTPARA